MSRFSPQGRVENRSGEIIGQAIAQALGGIAARRRQGEQDRKQDERDQRATTIQDIGLAKEGIHMQRPGQLPPLFDVNVSGGQSPEDIINRAITPAGVLAPSESGRGTPLTATPSRNLSIGDGYYVDHDEQGRNAAQSSESRFNAIVAEALAKGKAEETLNPGARQTDLAYKQALTEQARSVAGKQAAPAQSRIDPLSEEGIRAQEGLLRLRGSLRPTPAPKDTEPKVTEFSNKAALVYPKAEQAAAVLEEFYTNGVPAKQGASRVPVLGNYMLSPDEQRAQQAAEAVSMAILRLESGASVSDEEMKNQAKQIIPSPGDSPEAREQKRATLRTILTRMKAASQPTLSREPKAKGVLGDTGNVDLRPHVQTIDEMIRAGKSDAEIKAAMQRGVR